MGCKNEVKNVVNHSTDPETTPTIASSKVMTLVSDSGVTKYRISAERWDIYDESKVPSWKFPQGLHMEQFDSDFKVVATFDCDSAIYLKQQKLWRFMSNVRSWNSKNELILTNELYWNQNDKKVYSDSFIHIEQPERVLEGFGFVSNEQLTTYTLKRPMGIFPVEEEKRKARRDSLAAVRDTASLM